MRDSGLIRRAVVAGTLALSLTGIMAGVDSAQALPVAAPLARQALPGDSAAGAVITVQYYPYGYRGYRRPYYGYRRGYYGYGRRAGVYNCGPYAYHTRLSRKACR